MELNTSYTVDEWNKIVPEIAEMIESGKIKDISPKKRSLMFGMIGQSTLQFTDTGIIYECTAWGYNQNRVDCKQLVR
jgi:hypothetical protein